MKYILKYPFLKALLFCAILSVISCQKLVEIPAPPTSISSDNVFTDNETSIAVLTGVYISMNGINNLSADFFGTRGLTIKTGLSSDELSLDASITGNAAFSAYYTNSLRAASTGDEMWVPLYNYIFKCNGIIEGLTDEAASALAPTVQQQLLGEAQFLRAFFYFHLVNLFGEVPLVLTTDYKVNTLLAKSTTQDIYLQIIKDLKVAQQLLSNEYLGFNLLQTTPERVRPTSWAALALLARVYLYTGDYTNAASISSMIIEQTTRFYLPTLNNVFLKNSPEAIWQLQPTTVYFNTEEARYLVIPTTGPSNSNPVRLNPQLLKSFETGDQRAVYGNWIDSTIYLSSTGVKDTAYFPYKYKKNTLDSAIAGADALQKMSEYQMVFRLGEQFLIRAEARAQLNNLQGAIADVDMLRSRAGLPLIATSNPGISQTNLLAAILHERQVELFSEWGHRWFDLKRTGNIDAVMTIATPLKSLGLTSWESYQQLYPIPQSDINRAPNLTQNTGY